MPPRAVTATGRWLSCVSVLIILLLAGCSDRPLPQQDRPPVEVTLHVDGETHTLTSRASNVRELLEEADVILDPPDEVDPPLFTPLSGETMTITVIRITESIELLERAIPFDRKFVRNEAMSAEDDPVIIQAGRPGVQEVTVRIVYHDGLEVERRETQAVVIEEPKDEIVMVGLGGSPENVDFTGHLAFISGGNSVLLRGGTTFPETLNTGGGLDRRVFSLSPTGSHLLYTRASDEPDTFNTLWIISTTRDAQPQALEINNVLWADWNPAVPMQIAYTTAEKTELLPGWEANNDLWLADMSLDDEFFLETEQLIEAYPATYGWWGGHFAWSPDGRTIAYSYADEIGIIDTTIERGDDDDDEDGDRVQRTQLFRFTEYNTRADWVWVPSLSWSPDGRYLAFTSHSGDNPDGLGFDNLVIDVSNEINGRFATQSGIWSHAIWSPALREPSGAGQKSQIAFLRATNPLDSLRSSYTLWLMDADGSNAHQIYPPAGENSRFPRERQFMAWGPRGRDLAFVFNEDLYLLNLENGESYRLTEDDNVETHPTWAPYGYGIDDEDLVNERVPRVPVSEDDTLERTEQ